jgi:hypothetical protein
LDESDSERETLYDPIWNVEGDDDGREVFKRLARRAVVALGQKFTDPAKAVDFWLNQVHAHHARRNSWRLRDPWCIRNLLEASAECSAELATSLHEAANLEAEKKFAELEQQFRARPSACGLVFNHPWEHLYAISRRDVVLYPTEPAAPVSTERQDIRAERRKLRDDYKAECKRAGLLVTDEMIAKSANPSTSTNKGWNSRFQVQKWLACDPAYEGRADAIIRKVFLEKPHLKGLPR